MVNNDPVNSWDYLGLSCKCGPDITEALRKTLKEVGTRFRALSVEERDRVASSFVSGGGWDIVDLKVGRYTRACGERDATNSKECQDSVTVEGKCYYKGSVNYILYGRMFRLAEKWRIWRRLSIGLYKGIPFYNRSPNIYPSQQWAMVGNHNWAPSPQSLPIFPSTEPTIQESWDDYDPNAQNLLLPPSDRPNCQPCSVKVSDVLHGHAGGMRW